MIWRRKRRPKPSPETTEARTLLERAQADLAAARADDDQVDAAARRLAEIRRRNHFGPMITDALRGSR
ncbi:DUF7620 family protein [Micromonospora robiginosa]|uniref:Uncharacterized protein n=1 Tax=Micromonospora robiginosa TaxID=2749844 RepID=A0A7L6B7L9_9ACTN|nr:hypothetical protein [Micromonospora ferruginea]QLQ38003.1 hypothetical protein H1D33_03670 [Micromonospora ferruginea]